MNIIFLSSFYCSCYLKNFFLSYKNLDLREGEVLQNLQFRLPEESGRYNFEKVSKRTHLDIASVNSACYVQMENDKVKQVYISAGGVNPVPAIYVFKNFTLPKYVPQRHNHSIGP